MGEQGLVQMLREESGEGKMAIGRAHPYTGHQVEMQIAQDQKR